MRKFAENCTGKLRRKMRRKVRGGAQKIQVQCRVRTVPYRLLGGLHACVDYLALVHFLGVAEAVFDFVCVFFDFFFVFVLRFSFVFCFFSFFLVFFGFFLVFFGFFSFVLFYYLFSVFVFLS